MSIVVDFYLNFLIKLKFNLVDVSSEAAALKVPVLCSNNTALNDFNFFEQNHIDISNQELFKERLADLIESRPAQNLETIAQNIRQKYDWQKTADTFYKLLKQHSQHDQL